MLKLKIKMQQLKSETSNIYENHRLTDWSQTQDNSPTIWYNGIGNWVNQGSEI